MEDSLARHLVAKLLVEDPYKLSSIALEAGSLGVFLFGFCLLGGL